MYGYYFGLAIRSLKRNVVLTVLMIAAVGVGIGASMTTLTVFRAMSADPIPGKSRQLFAVQIDNWGQPIKGLSDDNLQPQISYIDAIALRKMPAARRQSAMYSTGAALTPSNPALLPFQVHLRAAYADFFPMFLTPFRFGAPWSAEDDEARSEVVVITRALNDKVFGGANPLGKTLNLDGRDFRVVGVLDHWEPMPRFYDINNGKYGKTEEAFIPFTRAIANQMLSWGNYNCQNTPPPGWEGRLRSECVWLQYWVELPAAEDIDHYRAILNNYATDQQHSGRFHWAAHTQLRNVREWLDYQHVVSDEVRILVMVSFSFLLVCLLNAMGLMLAKIMGRSADIGVRRALGANRRAIFSQCLIEAAVIGVAGGALGLLLTGLGLLGLRSLLSDPVSGLTRLSLVDIAIAVSVSILATTAAGLYPTWRAVQIQPAWQLKSQ
jgi:putative ABC transport system permease protein